MEPDRDGLHDAGDWGDGGRGRLGREHILAKLEIGRRSQIACWLANQRAEHKIP